MTDKETRLILGSLLQDVGKVIYRQEGYKGGHSQSGYEFLKDELSVEDPELLELVRYHHKESIYKEGLPDDSPAYIGAAANGIAYCMHKSRTEGEDETLGKSAPLESVFNRLNGNHEKKYYKPSIMDGREELPFPQEECQGPDGDFYERVRQGLRRDLCELKITPEAVNYVLEVLEKYMSYIPASSETDIPLYDHARFTAAAAGCISGYLEEKGIRNYREELFRKEAAFRGEEVFCLYYLDLSGIQSFIYTIASRNAFKTLRARSFYLEILMEHIIDSLLAETGYSRVNLLYSGGGRCYILLPSSEKVRSAVEKYMEELNQWLTESFDISLYAVWGCASCSADSLGNKPEGSYGRIFRRIVEEVERKKGCKYTAAQIIKLNSAKHTDYTRECKVCKKIGRVDEDGVCSLCGAFRNFSGSILQDDFFAVTREKGEEQLPLPGQCGLWAGTGEELEQKKRQGEDIVRIYAKNQMAGYGCTRLWVGDYASQGTFEEYARQAEGIPRIGILRADVDDLGRTFMNGFENPEQGNRYVTLTRTAVLSRQLSLFFKLHINRILSRGGFSAEEKGARPRNAAICYAGGDDLFIVGAWNEVIELALDIRKEFERYTRGTLTFSAGIGVYEHDYPIGAIAGEVAEMEDASKGRPGKNAVTLLSDGKYHKEQDGTGGSVTVGDGTYGWTEFEQCVIGEKYREISRFFRVTEERGNSFLYHLLELIRNREDKINFARYVYLLSRMEPEKEAEAGQKEAYGKFSSQMYRWIQDEKDCRELKTAIQLYVYLHREKEEM